jgi:hypothetical protein
MTTEAPEKEAKPKAEKPKKECECGCGMPTTKRFAVGHDARFKSALFSIVRGEDPKVVCPAAEDLTVKQAEAILDQNGWGRPVERKPKAKKEEVAEEGAPAKPKRESAADKKARLAAEKEAAEDF